ACVCLKCLFRIIKQQFRILSIAPEYGMMVQTQILPALTAIHNFIHLHDQDRAIADLLDAVDPAPGPFVGELAVGLLGAGDRVNAKMTQDEIAQCMWEDYVHVTEARANGNT
ncbi:hypothetical protein K439DRAFT_1335469, partial [Ramaria rubella]